MQVSPEIVAAIVGSSIGASVLILTGIIRWFDRRLTKIEGNVAKAQNGKLQEFITEQQKFNATQDKRHLAVCRRQNKLQKVVTGFIQELNAFRAVNSAEPAEVKTENQPGSQV